MSYMRDSKGRRLDSIEIPARPEVASFPERNVNGRGRIGTNLSNGTDTSQTSRLRLPVRGNCVTVRLVYANFWQQSGANEPGSGNDVTVKASIENPALTAGDPTGAATIPVFFNGQRTAVMNNNGLLISDPVLVNVADGAPLWVRSMASVTAGGKWVNSYVTAFTGGVVFDGGGVLEGAVTNTDAVDSGTIGGSSTNAFGPVAILAQADSRKPSVAAAGDSIAIDTGTVTLGAMGYIGRACVNAGFPVLRIGEGAERALTVASAISYWKRTRLAAMCTHVISNYGTNDIFGSSRTLAQVKADLQTLWTMWSRMGLQVYQCTVLPRPTSTDGNLTLANQSIANAGQEAVRTGLNSWLRDTSSSGAVAQSSGTLRGIFDPCATIEVNAAGALTLNGGFWAIPAGSTITGTATGVTTSVITDSGQARTVNGDVGKVLAITSATTGAGQAGQVLSNTATAWTLTPALTTTPTGTVTYKVGPSYCADGTHPTEPAHILLGDALPVGSTLHL